MTATISSCDIIVPVWNRLDDTKQCLENLARNTGFPYKLIIIDNASLPDTEAYLRGLAASDNKITLIRNSQNIGFVKAVNQGLRISVAPYVCLLNNDTIPAKGWLEELISFAEANTDVGLLNPLCKGHQAHGTDVNGYASQISGNRGKFMEMNQCQGYCMLIKRAVIDKIGILDERFGLGGYDDTDYSIRAHLAGYRCVCVYSSYVFHKEHMSFDALGDRKQIQLAAEREYYNKWPRHLRVGLALTVFNNDDLIRAAFNTALSCARDWCWVNLFLYGANRENVEKQTKTDSFIVHQNVKMNICGWAVKIIDILIRISERTVGRKRNKQYDLFFIDNRIIVFLLKIPAAIAGCRILYLELKDSPAEFALRMLNQRRAKDDR